MYAQQNRTRILIANLLVFKLHTCDVRLLYLLCLWAEFHSLVLCSNPLLQADPIYGGGGGEKLETLT